MDNLELEKQRKATIERTQDETTWGGPAGDILTGIRNAENAPAERAIWELVQNARDVSWENEPAVIHFVRTEKGLEFSHQRKPFTNTSLESLIKQTSSKVRSDIKTVGKYGTGFLVTHQFGRIIHLAGLLQVIDDKDLYYPFTDLKIDRSFEDKEQLKDSLKRQSCEANSWGFDSEKLITNEHGETCFKYETSNEAQWNALKRAFDNAPNNAPYVLALNSQYIQGIAFEDKIESKRFLYKLGEKVQDVLEEGEKYVLKQTEVIEEIDNASAVVKSLYVLTSKDTDPRIDESILSIVLPIECNNEGCFNSVCIDSGVAKLYLSLPLIGTDKWGLNFIIHSPLFECENDSRNGLRIVSQGLGLPDNDNRKVLDKAYEIVNEWLTKSLKNIEDRKYLGKVSFDGTSKNSAVAQYNEELQNRWAALFENLPLVINANGDYVTPRIIFVLDEALTKQAAIDDKLKDALFAVISTYKPGEVSRKEDFLYWCEVINNWQQIDLVDHIFGIEEITKAVAELNIVKEESGIDDEWIEILLCITKYIIGIGAEALLSNPIIPNEAGTLYPVTALCAPDAFNEDFRKVLDEIVPEEKNKFIHTQFRQIGIANLTNYTEKEAKDAITARLSELQNSVSAKLREIAGAYKCGQYKPDDEKWTEVIDDTVIKAVLRLFTMWIDRNADNLEAKLHKVYSEYLNVTEFSTTTITKKYFTDCEQMWRTLLFEIVYRFERLSNEEQLAKKEWLKDLLAVLKNYQATNEYLSRYILFPDQKGKMRFADELVVGVGILNKIKDYYNSIVATEGKTIQTLLIDDGFAKFIPHEGKWDNQTVAGKIEDVICKVEGYPNIQNYAKKADVLQIVRRFSNESDEGKEWMGYFTRLSLQKTSILVSFAESDNVFKLLLQPKSRLDVMSELASNEQCDLLLSLVKTALENKMFEDADMQYKRALGLYVETYLVEQLKHLLSENETIKALPSDEKVEGEDVQGGQDIIVYLKKGENQPEPVYYIEVKSRWSTRESVDMSKLQLEISAQKKENYALCVVDMHDYDKDKVFRKEYPTDFNEIKCRISVVPKIGERNADLVPYIQDSSSDVHLGGEIKSVVPQVYVKNHCITFDDLMKVIEQKVKDRINEG
jgi:hypothetical protein